MNSPIRLSRFTRANSGRIGVSFEFFPPNSEETVSYTHLTLPTICSV